MNWAMDWTRAIEINRDALTRIIVGLVALLAAQGGALRLPLPVYREIARVLHKAESAVRRLIVVAARKLVVPLPSARPMPQGLVIVGRGLAGTQRVAFQLFDDRQHFFDSEVNVSASGGPRIRVVGDADPYGQFLAQFAKPPDHLSSAAGTLNLRRRLEAVERALGNLRREAKRMVRWRARRIRMGQPKFSSPIRPGPPPGNNKHSKADIDSVLRECHGLAWDVLTEDTS